jgi:hypothetical protein
MAIVPLSALLLPLGGVSYLALGQERTAERPKPAGWSETIADQYRPLAA